MKRFTIVFLLILIICIIGKASADAVTPPIEKSSNLVLYLPLDEGTGTITSDQSGNGNDGVISNCTWVVGRYGYALEFPDTGGNSYIKINTSDSLNVSYFTIAFWIYIKEDRTNSNVFKITKYIYPTGYTIWLTWSGGSSYAYPGIKIDDESGYWSTDVNLGEWVWVVIIYDGTYAKLYVNGKYTGNDAYVPAGAADANAEDLYIIGNDVIVDEIRMWNTTLTASEIEKMYEALRVKIYNELNFTELDAVNSTLNLRKTYQYNLSVDSIVNAAIIFHKDLKEYGDFILTAISDGYEKRNYVVNLMEQARVELNAYLPPSDQAVTALFKLKDYTGRFTQNPILIMKKATPNGLITVLSQYFDTSYQTYVYLVSGEYYQIYISNGQEMRNVGYYTTTVSTSSEIIIGNLTIQPVTYGKPVQFKWSIDNDTITFEYATAYGTTTYVNFTLKNETSTIYYAESTEQSGSFMYSGLNPNETTWLIFYANNTEGEIYFKTVLFAPTKKEGIVISPPLGNLLFGGLAILVALIATPLSLPFGLVLATAVVGFATYMGWMDLGWNVVWALAVISIISFFVESRMRGGS